MTEPTTEAGRQRVDVLLDGMIGLQHLRGRLSKVTRDDAKELLAVLDALVEARADCIDQYQYETDTAMDYGQGRADARKEAAERFAEDLIAEIGSMRSIESWSKVETEARRSAYDDVLAVISDRLALLDPQP